MKIKIIKTSEQYKKEEAYFNQLRTCPECGEKECIQKETLITKKLFGIIPVSDLEWAFVCDKCGCTWRKK